MNILLVGYGRMGQALFKSCSNLNDFNISVVSPHCPSGENFFRNINELPDSYRPDIILLCVKPQIMADVASEYAKILSSNTLIVSVAAGFSAERLQNLLPGKIIRAMPNLAVSVGQGVIGLYAISITGTQRKIVESLFDQAGKAVWVDSEEAVNALTAISGSGPAYFYYMTECLAQAAENLGFAKDIATLLAEQTFVGAAEVLLNTKEQNAEDLRNQVTSPNGTTAAGIAKFEDNNLNELIRLAVVAAFNRAQELSK